VRQIPFLNGQSSIPKECKDGQYLLRWEENGRVKQVKIIKSRP
jgi:hypothetical protein